MMQGGLSFFFAFDGSSLLFPCIFFVIVTHNFLSFPPLVLRFLQHVAFTSLLLLFHEELFSLLLLFCEEQSSLELCCYFISILLPLIGTHLLHCHWPLCTLFFFPYCCSRGKRFVSHFCAFNVFSLLFAFTFFVVICSCLSFFPFAILLFSFVCLFSRYYKWCFGFKFNIKSLGFHFMVSFNIVFLLFKIFLFVVLLKLQIILVHIDFYFLVISITQDYQYSILQK
jgi:hypothetical protein